MLDSMKYSVSSSRQVIRYHNLAISLLAGLLLVFYHLSIQPLTTPFHLSMIFQTLLSIWLPLAYGGFTFAHLIVSHVTRQPLNRLDLYSYIMLPFLPILAILTHQVLILNTCWPVFYILTVFLKSYILFHTVIPGLRRPGSQKPRYWVMAISTFVILLPIGGWLMENQPLNGDEPYYLLISYSLIHDHDINLENNILYGHSLHFSNRRLVPQKWDDYKHGRLISRHTAFLPLILGPGLYLAGRTGAVITMNLLATCLGLLIVAMTHRFTGSLRSAYLSYGFFLFTAPILLYSQVVYAEIPGALLGMLSFWSAYWILKGHSKCLLLAGLTLAAAGYLKMRYLFLCAPVIMFSLIMIRPSGKRLFRISMIFISIGITIAGINILIYGSPFVRYHLSDLLGTTPARIIRGVFSQVWDIQYGVLPLNPGLMTAFIGIPLLMKKQYRQIGLLWMISILPYYLVIAGYAELIGGYCPRGRFQTAWLPLLTIPFGMALALYRHTFHRIFFQSGMIAGITITHLLLINPAWQINLPGGTDKSLEALSDVLSMDLLGVIPAFDRIDPMIYQTGFILSGALLTLMILHVSIHRIFSRRSHWIAYPSVSMVVLLIFFISIPMVSSYLSTPWMETEDRTFIKHRCELFWEEPFRWDQQVKTDQPYTVGVVVYPQSIIERKLPVRQRETNGKKQLEVIAKAGQFDTHVPILTASIGQQKLGYQRLRSNTFESYFFDWPSTGMASAETLQLTVQKPDDNSQVSAIVDKIRLIESGMTTSTLPMESGTFLPAHFNTASVNTAMIPQRIIRQSTPLPLKIVIPTDTHDGVAFSIRFQNDQRVYDMNVPKTKTDEIDLQVPLPAELGTGKFHVMISGRNNDQTILPSGEHVFRIGEWAYLGTITITPHPIPASAESITLLRDRYQSQTHSLIVLPQSVHLGNGDSISIPLKPHPIAQRIVFLSNLSYVFSEIPFETQVGKIKVVTSNGTEFDYPLIIGRQTAEEMYEIPLKKIKIPHPQAEVASRKNKIVLWPPLIRGIEYPSVTYQAAFIMPDKMPVSKIEIACDGFSGVLNIFAIGFGAE